MRGPKWTALTRYCENGALTIDNNVSERALRKVVTGRLNWTFCGSDAGGERAAILDSVVATCKAHASTPGPTSATSSSAFRPIPTAAAPSYSRATGRAPPHSRRRCNPSYRFAACRLIGDSLLGIVAPGWQDGVSELRRVAGAICCAVPDSQVLIRSISYRSNVFLLSEAGAEVLNAFAPILPHVGNARVLHAPELDIFRATLAPRVDAKHDRRFRIALQFLSTGWVLTGPPEFMNYFVSLDALLGTSNGKWYNATRKRAAAAMQADDAEGQLDLMIKIRNELMHGRCNSVERSHWYFEYYRRYHLDPTHGLLRAVRHCLRNDPS